MTARLLGLELTHYRDNAWGERFWTEARHAHIHEYDLVHDVTVWGFQLTVLTVMVMFFPVLKPYDVVCVCSTGYVAALRSGTSAWDVLKELMV